MSDKAIRLIKILQMIPEQPRRISCRDLVNRLKRAGFEVTPRTVQRDLVELSNHFQMVCDHNSPPGWSFMRGTDKISIPSPSWRSRL